MTIAMKAVVRRAVAYVFGAAIGAVLALVLVPHRPLPPARLPPHMQGKPFLLSYAESRTDGQSLESVRRRFVLADTTPIDVFVNLGEYPGLASRLIISVMACDAMGVTASPETTDLEFGSAQLIDSEGFGFPVTPLGWQHLDHGKHRAHYYAFAIDEREAFSRIRYNDRDYSLQLELELRYRGEPLRVAATRVLPLARTVPHRVFYETEVTRRLWMMLAVFVVSTACAAYLADRLLGAWGPMAAMPPVPDRLRPS